jgi:hypothetical protein
MNTQVFMEKLNSMTFTAESQVQYPDRYKIKRSDKRLGGLVGIILGERNDDIVCKVRQMIKRTASIRASTSNQKSKTSSASEYDTPIASDQGGGTQPARPAKLAAYGGRRKTTWCWQNWRRTWTHGGRPTHRRGESDALLAIKLHTGHTHTHTHTRSHAHTHTRTRPHTHTHTRTHTHGHTHTNTHTHGHTHTHTHTHTGCRIRRRACIC